MLAGAKTKKNKKTKIIIIVIKIIAVESSHHAGSHWQSWSEELVHADTFSLFDLSCTAATLSLQDAILAGSVQDIEDQAVSEAMNSWTSLSQKAAPAEATKHEQKPWDTPISEAVFQRLLGDVKNTPTDTARLRPAASSHCRDCLHAPPIIFVGLRMSDEAIRVAVGFRLGAVTCQPRTCLWLDGRRQGPAWSVLQEECAASNRPRPNERPCLASSEAGGISNSEGTGWLGKDGRQKTRWSYPYLMDERKTPSVEYHHPRYLRPLLHRWYLFYFSRIYNRIDIASIKCIY